MGAQSGAVMQVCLHKRCAFMQLLIKTTNVMTNFVCKIYMYIWYVCKRFQFRTVPMPVKALASHPPTAHLRTVAFCLILHMRNRSAVCFFDGSHAHYRQKANCMPRADYLYPGM